MRLRVQDLFAACPYCAAPNSSPRRPMAASWFAPFATAMRAARRALRGLAQEENGLAAKEVKHERQHERNHEAGDDREVEPAAFALDADVARQPPEAELGEPGPGEARGEQHRADDDERALHPAILSPEILA